MSGLHTGIRRGVVMKRILVSVVLVVAFGLPFTIVDYQLGLLCSALYFTVAVLSMNVLVGMNGQISIGHGAFIGIGAYVSAILVADHGWSYWVATAASVLVTAMIGVAVSLPALRLRGLYVALTTLGIALVFPGLVQTLSPITGGSSGKAVLQPFSAPEGLSLTAQQWTYLVLLVLTLLSLLLVRNLKHSRMGRAMMAVRDRDQVAEAFGIALARTKVCAFAVSAAFAGLAGSMFTIQYQYVSADDFGLTTSINLLVGMAMSGPVSVFGALVGGVFLQFVPSLVRDVGIPAILTPALYGAVLIAFTIFMREGVVGGSTRLIRNAARRKAARRWRSRSDLGTAVAEPTAGTAVGVDNEG